MSVSDTV